MNKLQFYSILKKALDETIMTILDLNNSDLLSIMTTSNMQSE